MAVEIKHSTVVVVPDDGTSPVGSDEWNAAHVLTQAGARMLGKPTAGAGPTEEMDGAAVLAFAGAEAAGTAAAAVAAHVAASDPHPVYLTGAEGDAAYAPLSHSHPAAQISDSTAAGRAILTAADAAAQRAAMGVPPTARSIATTAPLAGGGDLSADRTLTVAEFSSTSAGVVPASGGGTTNFLRADGTWAAPPGGGGGSPGGNTGEVQYNNAGAFAGAANVEIESGNLRLVATSDPAIPAAGGIQLYAKSVAGRILPKIIGPVGIDTVLQVGLHGNSVFMVAPSSGTTAPTVWGGTLTTAATMSLQQTIASANPWLATSRKRFQTSTTAGNVSGMRTAYVQWFRGSAAGFGGFFFRVQFGMSINLNGGQKFIGLCARTAALAGEPSALLNMIGMGYDSTDPSTGNWFLMRNDGTGAATKVDLGATDAARNTTHGYDLIIFCPPGAATEIFVRIVNLHTRNVVLDTSYTTDLPAANTGMAFKAEVRNGAVAAADNIEVAKVYIETDY